jgi:hypothetical protein
MDEKQSNHSVLTDYERTRMLIWDSYAGITENHSRYRLYEYYKKNDKVSLGGIYRYTYSFFEIVRNLLEQQDNKLKDVYSLKDFNSSEELYEKYFDNEEFVFTFKDFVYLKRVATEFMFHSRMMDISYTKNNLSAFAKSQSS